MDTNIQQIMIEKSVYKSFAIRAAEMLTQIRHNGPNAVTDAQMANLINDIKEATQ